ncbi:MAG: MMPL family transporter [Candidatus Thiodiazotropha sp.]|nr:MMPL family transporter [Candidatus Thiodiazotropha sp.]MCM8885111.1 MMPL family transporter [Candidatus Thiodiazotropha sp.]MCM8921410.1 MMPL family transporter [Candidatus Thiodiazotropha sp.]
MNRFTAKLHKIDGIIFSSPKVTLALIVAVTLFFAYQIPGVRMASDFADLLPQQHPYIQLHNEIRDTFGGANNVIVAVEVTEGTIFTNETLQRIHRITQAVDSLYGINHNLVTSLTHRNTRKVWLNEEGTVKSAPHFDPSIEKYTEDDLQKMQTDVIANRRVFGLLVSPDLKSALIRGTLNEGELDYEKVFNQLQEIREKESASGIKIHATGNPVLVGWVSSYADQVVQIFLYTILIMLMLLILYFRKLYGILLPTLGIVLTSIWGLGILSLLGHNLDPLMLVVPFLISARAMSHGIQLVERYYHDLQEMRDSKAAARSAFENLFRPGSLGVISDAIGLLLISLGSVPINDKLAVYASLWALSVVVTVLIMVPVLLELLPAPRKTEISHNLMRRIIPKAAGRVTSPGGVTTILIGALMLYGVGGYFASWVQIGEAEPGSPLLYLDHDYNLSSKAVNEAFPGSEELYIIAHTEDKGGIKRPEVVKALADFEAHMLTDPDLGAAKGLPDLVMAVNRITHYDDPRWLVVPEDSRVTGGLMFMYMMSSPIPGALLEFADTDEQSANLVFYYKDHQGTTIRRAIHMAKQWVNSPAAQVEGLTIKLAGGLIGVTAAINEAAYETNLMVIPLVLALIFVSVTFFYWSLHAGWLMMLAMSFATTLTYAYMGLTGIGINVNTVPIIAVGIGVGIDYSIYIMDRIRAEYERLGDLRAAVKHAISTTGVAIGFTAMTLIGGVVMWVFISDLRFQADAALLLIVMLILNAVAAMNLVPAWILKFKPTFIIQAADDVSGSSESKRTVESPGEIGADQLDNPREIAGERR